MSQYWTDLVHKLDPYIPGEQPQDQQYVKLNTNENPYPPSPKVTATIDNYNKDHLKLYPDPESTQLRQALAQRFGVQQDNVFVGNGSDEVLAHSFQAFFKQSKPLVFPDLSYSFYPVYCGLYEIESKTIPINEDFSININDFDIDNGGIIIPNPNAPTSMLMPLADIEQLCKNNSSVVIIDEAYIDFGGESAIPLTRKYDNLLVIQTFSKSRSLAGLRLGYAIGHKDLIEGLNRVKDSFNSYPIDSLAQTAAVSSIEDDSYFQQTCQKIVQTREQASEQLTRLGFKVLPSAANFIFACHESRSAQELYSELKKAGVLVRYFNKPRIDNYLRITIGTEQEMQKLIATLSKILQQN
ncbi:MAG: histidinol-phosphate transaminase [Gammaproteobacteria bacterium]|jgi:histidinol-phosphate aminotransferase|nr:histidinol-phosphate transaminase [Gammaproteobacteria bacterium]MBT3725938.1 histidinol-phosphate transaminase [Gammaproteobacteria bacterium]MBT4195877.1 histidinol-phosphate transaminase [Gammaproteobacteria bacterium]MBT4448985.1 histidinol-phosphate transaminase [Gammaproteobacteria bacterium]MBT4861647.1 histidinol-phosphate transaminase [Gammaproteobacteria bacterium]